MPLAPPSPGRPVAIDTLSVPRAEPTPPRELLDRILAATLTGAALATAAAMPSSIATGFVAGADSDSSTDSDLESDPTADPDAGSGVRPSLDFADIARPPDGRDLAPSRSASVELRERDRDPEALAATAATHVPSHARLVIGEGADRIALAVSAHDGNVTVRAHAQGELAAAFVGGAAELRDALRRQGLALTDVSARGQTSSSTDHPSQSTAESQSQSQSQRPAPDAERRHPALPRPRETEPLRKARNVRVV